MPPLIGCIAWVMVAVNGFAQPPAAPTHELPLNGFEPAMTIIAPVPPRSRAEMAGFVESLSANDAMFEVLVGQGRILTLKKIWRIQTKRVP